MTRKDLEDNLRVGLREGYTIPLLPRNRVYLLAPSRDGRRFAELFRKAWKRIPLRVRRKILTHWKHGDPNGLPRQLITRPSPQIDLFDDWGGGGVRHWQSSG